MGTRRGVRTAAGLGTRHDERNKVLREKDTERQHEHIAFDLANSEGKSLTFRIRKGGI